MARDDRSRGRRVREDHGPGCPADRFDRDAWSGIYQYGSESFIAERVCDLIEEAVPCIVLPTMHYNICAMTKNYPGVISIPSDVMTQMYDAIFRECARNGFKKIFAAVCHGGSETPVQFLANMVHERATAEAPGKPAEPDYYLFSKTLSAAGAEEYAQDSLVEVLAQLDLGDVIPLELYQVIAEVLVYVYKINSIAGVQSGGRSARPGPYPRS